LVCVILLQEFPALDALREDMTTTAGAWELYNEFSEALSKLSGEDWISFRGRLYELEDLIKDWQEKLRGATPLPPLRTSSLLLFLVQQQFSKL
jgi:hypothetical protein